MFNSVEDVIQQLSDQEYICDKQIATVVFLAQQLDKPVLIEGPAGVGKTELAKVVSQSLGREMIRTRPRRSTNGNIRSSFSIHRF
jgi:MoxR-like ATPase